MPDAVSPTGSHLVLVGLMGAGKSTVGRRCAELLDRAFVDTDDLVEAAAHLGVAQIFEQEGEAAFRARERAAVADACASPAPLVIACGGGAVLDAGNRRRLHDAGFVVWLRASPAALDARVGAEAAGARPLLRGPAPVTATLERLAATRAPAYEAAADVAVDTDGLAIDEVADRVIEEWRAWSG